MSKNVKKILLVLIMLIIIAVLLIFPLPFLYARVAVSFILVALIVMVILRK